MSHGPEPVSEKKDTIAVCIPTYNQAAYLAEAIRSVLAQELPADEIVVSDDASTDETPQICEQFAREFPRFRYFRQPQNLGMGANVEFVLRQAKSTYVARLDSDDRLLPGFLLRLVPALRDAPDAGYAHANVWQINEAGKRERLRTLYRDAGFQTAREAIMASLRGYRVAANIVLFRKSALDKVEIMKGKGDFSGDYHLSVSLARAGYGNVFVAETLSEYREWVDPKGLRARRLEQIVCGLVRVYNEQIEPAFKEEGLSLKPVRRVRRLWAIRAASSLGNAQNSPGEEERLRSHLIELGDCWRLRLVFFLVRIRLGFLVRGYWRFTDFCRATAKNFLQVLKRS